MGRARAFRLALTELRRQRSLQSGMVGKIEPVASQQQPRAAIHIQLHAFSSKSQLYPFDPISPLFTGGLYHILEQLVEDLERTPYHGTTWDDQSAVMCGKFMPVFDALTGCLAKQCIMQ